MEVQINKKESELLDDFDNRALVREQLSMISSQLAVLKRGLDSQMSHSTLSGSISALMFIVDSFYSDAAGRVEEMTARLIDGGLREYVGSEA